MQDDLLDLLFHCDTAVGLSLDLSVELTLDHFEGLLDLDLDVLLAFNQGVMDKGVQKGHNVFGILSQDSLNDLTVTEEDPFLFKQAESVHDVLGQTERNNFGDLEFGTLFKDTVKVDMCHLTCVLMDQDVISMSITQSNHIAYHRPYSSRADEVKASLIPDLWGGEVVSHPHAQDRLNLLFDLVPYGFMGLPLFKLDSACFDFLHLAPDVMLLPLLTNDRFQS